MLTGNPGHQELRVGLVASVDRVLKPTPVYGAVQAFYRYCFKREFLRERRRMMDFYARFVRRGDLCVDVGANYGSRTEVFLALGARVVAVEPAPKLARALRDRFAHRRGVEIVEAALGPAPGRADLHVGDIDKVSTLATDWVQDCARTPHLAHIRFTPTPVEVTTLDALIVRVGRPAFVKIDVEGFEHEVLRGLSAPVPALSFEYTPWRAPRAAQCVRRLGEIGRWRFNVSRGESMTLRHERWLDETEILVFCLEQVPDEPEYGDIYAAHDPAD